MRYETSLACVARHDQPPGFADRFDHRFVVKRNQRARVDDFGFQSVLGREPVCRLESAIESRAVGLVVRSCRGLCSGCPIGISYDSTGTSLVERSTMSYRRWLSKNTTGSVR
jgi:hypothetical protein